MNNSPFISRITLPGSTTEELYRWHSRPGALQRLIPAWERTQVLAQDKGIEVGSRVLMRMHFGPVPFLWQARHTQNVPGQYFTDIQEKGPFAHWEHRHGFKDTEAGAQLSDRISYALPCQRLLPACALSALTRMLDRTFRYRHAVLRDDLLLHRRYGNKPMRLLVSGGGGMLGRSLIPLLTTGGHEVWRLVRRMPDRSQREIYWNPEKSELNLSGLPAFDGLIHLGASNIGTSIWTKKNKQEMLDSRVRGTALLARALASPSQRHQQRPKVLLSASAVGVYGNCADNCMLEEANQTGGGFLSELCSAWEQAAKPAEDAGIRTVFLRIGVVLGPQEGALGRLLAASAFGLPRRFGTGDQYISWISLHDATAAMLHALCEPSLAGPVNIVAPHPVRNTELLRTLAKVLRRPLLPPLPATPLRALYGEMADEVLLAGCRADCDKLARSGFVFRHPELESCLRFLLGR